MSDVQQLLDGIAASRKSHLMDVAHLKRLVAIAEIGDGDPVKTLLDVCNGDVEQVQAYVETLHDITQSIFRRWLIAVRLDYLENKGGTR